MTVDAAARRLGVTPLTIKRWTKEGKLGSFRPHFRELLIPIDSLDRFERERLVETG